MSMLLSELSPTTCSSVTTNSGYCLAFRTTVAISPFERCWKTCLMMQNPVLTGTAGKSPATWSKDGEQSKGKSSQANRGPKKPSRSCGEVFNHPLLQVETTHDPSSFSL